MYHLPEDSWRSLPAGTVISVISSPWASIPPRRRARGATWQKVTPNKLFGPKRYHHCETMCTWSYASTWGRKSAIAQKAQR